MTINQKLEKLAAEISNPCVTISLNTHRVHPANNSDGLLLKNLLKEAEDRLLAMYDKRAVAPLLEKMANVLHDIEMRYNLESLHIFLSNLTNEFMRSSWPVNKNAVHISTRFAVGPLIKELSRSESYYILLLSQGGVRLYEAVNENISGEVKNENFPFDETPYYIDTAEHASDPKLVDTMVREFFNIVDKALVKIHNETHRNCVVICTEDNYSRLLQVANKPSIYLGYAAVDYNNTEFTHIGLQSWAIIKELQRQRRAQAVLDVQKAVSKGTVLTDLQEIYQAALDGRGDLLIVNQDFFQPVQMTSERTFNVVEDSSVPNVVDDITSNIAWEVISKKGKVVFTEQEQLHELGDIVMKTRY